MSSNERKSERTKREIRQKSAELFARKGYCDVTMSDVCRETGMSRGGIYRYYSNTAELFEDIVDSISLNLEKKFNEAIEAKASAVELLNIALDSYNSGFDTSLTATMYEYCTATGSKRVQHAFSESKSVWKKLIEYGIATGEFNDIKNPAEYADAVILVFEGARIASHVINVDADTFKGISNVVKNSLIKKEYLNEKS